MEDLIFLFKNIKGFSEHENRVTLYIKGLTGIKNFKVVIDGKEYRVEVICNNEAGKI